MHLLLMLGLIVSGEPNVSPKDGSVTVYPRWNEPYFDLKMNCSNGAVPKLEFRKGDGGTETFFVCDARKK